MYRKIITPIYVINIIFQAIISLLVPMGLMLGLSYLLVKFLSVGPWIYAVLIPIGAISGIFSMISFILSSCRALDAIEKQNEEKEKKK